jgi:hypothetical protein
LRGHARHAKSLLKKLGDPETKRTQGEKMQTLTCNYRRVLAVAVLGLAAIWPVLSLSQAFGPLRPGETHIRSETVVIAAQRAAGSDVFVPTSGVFQIEYSVEPGKEMLITMLTGEQYQEIAAGHRPTGGPIIRAVVSGTGQESASIQRGSYFIAFNNQGDTNTQISYRATFLAN